MAHKHLKMTDRDRIESLLIIGTSQTIIAKILKVNKSTISREIKKYSTKKDGSVKKEYLAEEAQIKANNSRRFSKYQSMKINTNLELSNHIKTELKKKNSNLSPKIIANDWNEKTNMKSNHITAESIYKWLDTNMGIEYKKYLLYKKGYKKTPTTKGSKIKDRTMIEKRDENINIRDRKEKGHFEADLVVSNKGNKGAVLTIIDRKTRFSRAWKIKDKSSDNIMKLIASSKDELGIISVTFDNGMEFAKHKLLQEIGINTYFCHSYSSWQKGSIENLNRLLRRTFPKGTNFNNINQEQIKSAIDIINNTPREILNFLPAKKVHF